MTKKRGRGGVWGDGEDARRGKNARRDHTEPDGRAADAFEEDAGGVTTSTRRRRRERPEPFDDGPPGTAPGPPPDVPVPSRGRRRNAEDNAFDDGPPGVAPGPPPDAQRKKPNRRAKRHRNSPRPPPSPSPRRRQHTPSPRRGDRGERGQRGSGRCLRRVAAFKSGRRDRSPQRSTRPSRAGHRAEDDDRASEPSPRRGPAAERGGGERRHRGGRGGDDNGKGGRRNRSNDADDSLADETRPNVSDDDIPGLDESKGLWGKRRRRRKEEVEQQTVEEGSDGPEAEDEDAELGQSDDQADESGAHPSQVKKKKNKKKWSAKGANHGSANVEKDDEELREVVYCVRLEMVPKEYNHGTLVELHETIGLRNFQSSGAVENPEDTEATHTMLLRYGDEASAETASAELHGQSVANDGGEVWELIAKVTKKEVANPMCSLYITDLPLDFTDRMLAEMHKDCGLGPEEAPVYIKKLPPRGPEDETCCCITRYKTSAAADGAINALNGLPVTTKSGENKTLGARRARPAKWMDGFGGAGAYTSGAYGGGGPGAYGGGGDYKGGGKGGKGDKGKWMEQEAERNRQPVECGVTLFGKVRSWNEERGFGMLLGENGGPDIFVHRKALCDGRYLEVDADVTFEVEFDVERGKYRTTMCHGAMGPDPRQVANAEPTAPEPRPASGGLVSPSGLVLPSGTPPLGPPKTVPPPPESAPPPPPLGPPPQVVVAPKLEDMSPELRGFCLYWGLDHSCVAYLASLDEKVQTQVVSEFNPTFTDVRLNINVKVRQYVAAVQKRLDSGIPEGSPIPGVVKQWNDVAKVGFVAHEGGKENSPHVLVAKSALTDGSHLVVGADVVFEAEWDATRGMHIASVCSGAEGEAPEPLALPDELAAFDEQFSFSRPTLMFLLELPWDVLARVFAEFPASVADADKATVNFNTLVRAFTVAMRAKAQVQIPCGVMLTGKCHSWMLDKGYGFVVADCGGGKVFVHMSHVSDGEVLEPGAPVSFEVQWESSRGRYTVTKCEGGVPKPGPAKPEVSVDLEAFQKMWDVDQDTLYYLATFPADVQAKVIKDFDPHLTEDEVSVDPDRRRMHARLRGFARSLKESWGDFQLEVEGPLEVSQQLSYFGKLWELDEQTVEWIARLPADVQTAVTEEYMGSFTDETLVPDGEPEVALPSEELFMSGVPNTLFGSDLPKHMQRGMMHQLFSQFGQVAHLKILSKRERPTMSNAIIKMSEVKQARMAVEDLHRKIPNGFPAPISVRFMVEREAKGNVTELECGKWLSGRLSAFYAERGFGFIQPDGGGPDVFCFGSALGSASKPLERGVKVTFEAAFNEERKQYFTTKVAVTGSGGLAGAGEGTVSSSRTVRAFARHVFARLKPETASGVLGPVRMPTAAQFTPAHVREFTHPITANCAPPATLAYTSKGNAFERNPALPAPEGGIKLWQTPAAKAVAAAAIAKVFEKANGGAGLAFRPPSGGFVLRSPAVSPPVLLPPGVAAPHVVPPVVRAWTKPLEPDQQSAQDLQTSPFGLPGVKDEAQEAGEPEFGGFSDLAGAFAADGFI